MPAASTPTVTVVIPTYNRGDLLPRAIQSVIAQTFQDWEVIIVDDGSTDDTAAVVQSFLSDRVRYVKLERNSGPSRARNVGIGCARGRYLAFLDSDDECLPHKLEVQLRRFETNPGNFSRLGVVVGRRSVQGGRSASASAGRLQPLRGDVRRAVFGAGLVIRRWNSAWPTMLVRREYLQEIGGFDEQLHASEWWDLCARLSKVAEFDDVDTPVDIYWQHTGSRAWTGDRRLVALQYLLAKYQRDIPFRRRHQSHSLLVIGVLELRRHRASVALRHFFRSLLLWPRPRAAWFLSLALWRTATESLTSTPHAEPR